MVNLRKSLTTYLGRFCLFLSPEMSPELFSPISPLSSLTVLSLSRDLYSNPDEREAALVKCVFGLVPGEGGGAGAAFVCEWVCDQLAIARAIGASFLLPQNQKKNSCKLWSWGDFYPPSCVEIFGLSGGWVANLFQVKRLDSMLNSWFFLFNPILTDSSFLLWGAKIRNWALNPR